MTTYRAHSRGHDETETPPLVLTDPPDTTGPTVAATPAAQRAAARRIAVTSVACTALVALVVLPITMTPYRSDDQINHRIPESLDQTSPLHTLMSAAWQIRQMVRAWARNEGRFFPGSPIWTWSVFGAFQTLPSYKLFLAVLSAVMMAACAAFAAHLLKTSAAAAVTVVCLAATMTLRTWFDPLDTFSGVLPMTICLTVLAALLLLRGRGRWSVVVAVVAWTWALTTYEVAILLTPLLCLLVWFRRRSVVRAAALAVPALAVGAVVLVLRSRVAHPHPGYAVNLDSAQVARTYLAQLTSPLPLAQLWYPGAAPLHVDGFLAALCLVVVTLLVLVVLGSVTMSRPVLDGRGIATLGAVGGYVFVVAPILVAITEGRQGTIPAGQGYVSVAWGYVAVALCLAAGWLATLRRWTVTGARRWAAAHLALTVVIGLTAALNVATSLTIARTVTG